MGQEADRRVGHPVPKELNCTRSENHLVYAIASVKGICYHIKDVVAFSNDVAIQLKWILTLSRKQGGGGENLNNFSNLCANAMKLCELLTCFEEFVLEYFHFDVLGLYLLTFLLPWQPENRRSRF